MQSTAFTIVSDCCVGCQRTAGARRRVRSSIQQVRGGRYQALALCRIDRPEWLLAVRRLIGCIPHLFRRPDRRYSALVLTDGRRVGIR